MQKRAFVLGGTSGLGRAIAELLMSLDISTVVAGRSAHEAVQEESLRKAQPFKIDLLKDTYPNIAEVALNPFDYIVWTSGKMHKGRFRDMTAEQIAEMVRVHATGPLRLLHDLHLAQIRSNHPYHLVAVSSTSSWRTRDDEAVYGMLKAAKSQFARNLGREIPRDIPGSRVLLVNPGGMKTNLWRGTSVDASAFMDPSEVASLIWSNMEFQCLLRRPFCEVQIMRQLDGSPKVGGGARVPE